MAESRDRPQCERLRAIFLKMTRGCLRGIQKSSNDALEFEYPVVEFAQMIAKIGYGYAVGERVGAGQIRNPLGVPGHSRIKSRCGSLGRLRVRIAGRISK